MEELSLGLVLDCRDPEALSTFWAPALGYANLGSVGTYVLLLPDGRPGPKLLLQQVPENKVAKNRMHFDIETAHVDDEVTRLEALGATRVDALAEHDMRWVVMTDPEGNEFCVCDGGPGC